MEAQLRSSPCIRHISGIVAEDGIHHGWHDLLSQQDIVFALLYEGFDDPESDLLTAAHQLDLRGPRGVRATGGNCR